MHKVDSFGATVENDFTDGDPQLSVPRTRLESKWMNALQRELIAPIGQAGIALDDEDDQQLVASIMLHAPNIAALRSLPVPALPSGRKVHVYLGGSSASDDGWDGIFRWEAASAAEDDGDTIIEPNTAPVAGRWARVQTTGRYRRTLAEIAAGVMVDYRIPSHEAIGIVNLYRYGYVGDGVADDWDAIQRGVAVINQLGGGTLLYPPNTTPRIYVGSQTGDLCSFVDLTGISVLGYGVVVTVDLSRTITASLGNFMHFSNCHEIKIDGFATNGPVLDISLTTVKSVVFARFVNGCTGVSMPMNKVHYWQAGATFENRDGSGFPLSTATRCRGIHIGVLDMKNLWHGLHCQMSGDDLVADLLITDTMHRSVFNYGCENQRINIRSKNHKAVDCRLLSWGDGTHTAQPLKNIYIRYASGTDSDACGSQQQKVFVGCWGDGPQVIDNIQVEFDVEYPTSGDGGGDAFTLVKLTDAAGSDTTTGRGHSIGNVSVRGRIKGQPTTAVGGVVSTDPNCDFDGETLSGRWQFDLDVDATTQVYLELGSLDASATLDLNINHPGEAVTVQSSGSVITLPANPAIDLRNTRCTNRYANVSGPRLALEYMTAGNTSPSCPAGWCKGSLKWLTTRSAGGTTTWALPAATVGMRIGVMRTDAQVLRLDPSGSEVIRGGGAGKYYGSNTDGASLVLYCHTAGTWEIEQERGTWAFEP